MKPEDSFDSKQNLPLEVSLTQLTSFSAHLPQTVLSTEPQRFHSALREIQETRLAYKPVISEPEKEKKMLAREKWEQLQVSDAWRELSSRELRAFLIVDDAVTNVAYLEKLTPQCSESRSAFREILTAYFRFWQLIHHPDNEAVKAQWHSMLILGLVRPAFPTERWTAYQYWKAQCSWLLTDEAPTALADLLFTKPDALSQSINEQLRLNVTGSDASISTSVRKALLNRVAQEPLASLKNGLMRHALDQWMLPLIDPDFLSNLILHANSLGDAELRDELKSWFLRHKQFGDPRLNDSGWKVITEDAKKVFKGWLSQADLKFFFEFALNSQDDEHGRKEFWLKYLGHVINSRVLITDEFRWMEADTLKKLKRDGDIQTDVLGTISGCNTFIMETDTLYIIEFAQKGNAAYLYDKKDPRFRQLINYFKALLALEKMPDQKIKNREIPFITDFDPTHHEPTVRCRHYPEGQWQQRLESWLRNRGIKPLGTL